MNSRNDDVCYSGQGYWDQYHRIDLDKDAGRTLQQETWLHCFIPLLQQHGVATVLDLGCGSGYDAMTLTQLGFQVKGADISGIAIEHACAQAAAAGLEIGFLEHDIATPLPYRDGEFDAVISNLTLHMFRAEIAAAIVGEVMRCLTPGGLFMFHVNSTDDIPFRSKLQPPVVPLGDEFFLFGNGQTMRFFSESDCRDLVAGFSLLQLEAVRMLRPDGQVQKCAWRCIAQKS
ncbi:MAG: class I SAM-dependent methyltransferase [Chromatiaceae bacterium]|nr:class I SAM-dependent methyltransferase [Chromatiaceae bacterium]